MVAYDYGIKRNILRRLVQVGARVTVVPALTSAEDVLALAPDGVFLSNGPGDPEPLIESGIVERARDAIQGAITSPLAKDMPYTPYTESTLQRLAGLTPVTLAAMHGSSFRGDCRKAILDLAVVLKDLLGKPAPNS